MDPRRIVAHKRIVEKRRRHVRDRAVLEFVVLYDHMEDEVAAKRRRHLSYFSARPGAKASDSPVNEHMLDKVLEIRKTVDSLNREMAGILGVDKYVIWEWVEGSTS